MSREKEYLKLTTVLFRAMQSVENVIKKDILSYSLNTSEFGTLELLYNRGKQPMQSIASRMLMANSSMTYVMDKLEQRGMIYRTPGEEDKRVIMVDLTDEGRNFFKSIFEHHVNTLASIFEILDEEELPKMIELLKKVGYHAKTVSEEK